MSKCIYYMRCPNTIDQCRGCLLSKDEVASVRVLEMLDAEYEGRFGADSEEFKAIMEEIGISLANIDNLLDIEICSERG